MPQLKPPMQEKLDEGVGLSEFERLEEKMEDWEVEVDTWETVEVDTLESQFRELEGDSPEIGQRLAELRETMNEPDQETEEAE